MLARRLLLFALVLLVVTSISAALAPPPPDFSDRPQEQSAPAPEPGASRVVDYTVSTARAEPPVIEVQAGDVLRLEVRSPESGSIALPGLGTVRAITPGTPVLYDLLPTSPGDYPLVALEDERTVATVRVVSRREQEEPDAAPSPRTTDT